MFDYHRQTPVQIETTGSETRGSVTVQDIRYASPVDGKPIGAYLVSPTEAAEKSRAGVLYVHWYEPHAADSNRTQFLDEAVTLAAENGIVSLLPETMWSEPAWYREGRSLVSDYQDAIHQVIELRRALDVLTAQPQVDETHIAYVGHDFGAMYGSLLIGSDPRPKAYILIAGASNFNHWMLFGVEPDRPGLDTYRAKMDALAPAHFVAKAAPVPVFFQFGTEDFYTPAEDVFAFSRAASEPKDIRLYVCGHAMDIPKVRADRLAYLRNWNTGTRSNF